jgi:hypothetical protein
MKKTPILFPINTMPLSMMVNIQTQKSLGLTAKIYIQEKARTLEMYNQSIECEVYGESNDGKKIAVDTVGRWLFGVPGYEGHIRIVSGDNQVLLYYPKESPKIVHELISALKEMIETNQ